MPNTYSVESKIKLSNLPVSLGRWVEMNDDLNHTTIIKDGWCYTLSPLFHEQDANRTIYNGGEVITLTSSKQGNQLEPVTHTKQADWCPSFIEF
jgi:hypothetical protein